jgi:hypothetical protein
MLTRKEKAEIRASIKKTFQDYYENEEITFEIIKPDDSSQPIGAPPYQLQSVKNKHMHLTIHHVNMVITDIDLPPFVNETEDGKFVLKLSEFLKTSHDVSVMTCESLIHSNYVIYQIMGKYNDIEVRLNFRESDVYPSESKYIITTAIDAIYNNTCRGE